MQDNMYHDIINKMIERVFYGGIDMKKIEWFGNHYEEVTEITERYGCYLLTITYREKGFTDVKVEDVSKLRLPLLFATSMTIEQANSYLTLFRNCGYIEIA